MDRKPKMYDAIVDGRTICQFWADPKIDDVQKVANLVVMNRRMNVFAFGGRPIPRDAVVTYKLKENVK